MKQLYLTFNNVKKANLIGHLATLFKKPTKKKAIKRSIFKINIFSNWSKSLNNILFKLRLIIKQYLKKTKLQYKRTQNYFNHFRTSFKKKIKLLSNTVKSVRKFTTRLKNAVPLLLTGIKDFFDKAKKRLFGTIKHQKIVKKDLSKTTVVTRSLKIKYILAGSFFSIILVATPLLLFFWFSELPNPRLLKNRDIPLTTKIYDRNKVLLYQIYANQNRTFIKLSDVPKQLKQATIATEDKNFYKHKGVDVRGIVRAALNNLYGRNGNKQMLQGGSSITQQLIKNALLSNEKTVSRKIKEIVLAVWAEFIYSKDEILEMYFNQVPYGGTAWGIEAGAETYFGKNVKDLSLPESALLAGITVAPTLYSPFGSHPELAKQRQGYVLWRMVEEGYINEKDRKKADGEKLIYRPQTTEIKAPHFVMYIKDLLAKKYGTKLTEQGGLSVVTSLDINIQEMAQEEVTNEVKKLDYLWVGNGAAMVVNPQNGEILAMVGSIDYFDNEKDGNVNVTLSQRQPGSSIKPVMYAAAFEKNFTPSSIIEDAPVVYNVLGQPPYVPVNYDGKWHGKVTIRNALGSSFNIPAVKILNSIGVLAMIEMGRKMGITTWEDESRFGLSLTLGGGEVTMVDLVTAYTVFANNGMEQGLNPILKITDSGDNILYQPKNGFRKQIISPQTAFWISNILADNNARTMAFGPNSLLRIKNKSVSVKTGTTNDKRDNWTIGYTPSILIAVWVGNNDNSPMNPYLASGITGAAPIWNKIMSNLLKNNKDEPFSRPQEMIPIPVCQWNGLLPCVGCPTTTEYFLPGREPKIHCQITPTPSVTPIP